MSQLPPALFHYSAPDAYRSIFRDGLRSTRTLLADFEIPAEDADRLISAPRTAFVTLGPHPRWGTIRLAHNGPLLSAPKVLARCLKLGGCTLQEFCRLLADRVFFWVNERDAVGYQASLADVGPYDRIKLRTSVVLRLAAEQSREVQVSRLNSGSVPRTPVIRGPRTWTSIGDGGSVKELVVVDRIDGLAAAATSVTRFNQAGTPTRIWAGESWG